MLSRQKLGTFLLNKVLQNYKKWKNVIDKSCSTIHILGRENHFRKDLVEFWHWKLTLNIEKCRFSRVFNQTVLQGIKKSSGHVYWDVKSYWISYASLWNSTTVITLRYTLLWFVLFFPKVFRTKKWHIANLKDFVAFASGWFLKLSTLCQSVESKHVCSTLRLILSLKRMFFRLFNFDGWYFWNHLWKKIILHLKRGFVPFHLHTTVQ